MNEIMPIFLVNKFNYFINFNKIKYNVIFLYVNKERFSTYYTSKKRKLHIFSYKSYVKK